MVKKQEIKRLHRSKEDRIIAGICGGLGEYMKVDPVIVRLIWVILFLVCGVGGLAYLLAWIIIPLEK